MDGIHAPQESSPFLTHLDRAGRRAANKSKRSFRLFEQVLIGAEVLQESSGHQTRRVGTCEIQ